MSDHQNLGHGRKRKDMDSFQPGDQEAIHRVSANTSDLTEEISALDSDEEKFNQIKNYVASCYQLTDDGHIDSGKNVLNITFDDQFQWINSQHARQNLEEDASSNLIIFDFFTHCCINCIHSIEDLRNVYNDIKSKRPTTSRIDDDKFNCGFKIISIHSPKFTTEKQTESITSSVQRMKLDHTEVINDPSMILWTKFGVYCWPTIMVFGPNIHLTNLKKRGPNLLFVLTGEGHRSILKLLCEASLNFFDEKLSANQVREYTTNLKSFGNHTESSSVPTTRNDQVDNSVATMLKFPGKVTAYQELICISDSGNNRIIICDLAGDIKHIIGGTEQGYKDGDFTTTRFYNPQGSCFQNKDILFIADTGNHCIRQVNLRDKVVTSLVHPNQEIGERKLVLKSPWDLCFYGPQVLLVAAAGNHQIFGYFFEQLTLFRVDHPANTFDLIAGSGREENRNNMYILKSSFAQPSGIACQGVNEDDKTIYIADSESSSIRYVNSGGRVMPLVGGSRDPANLFCYGDEDGVSYDVKFQHPMGVCSGLEPSNIFVADTYNHKIKMINVETKHCTTLIGDGTAKNQLGVFTGNVKPKRLGLAHPSSTNISKSSPLALLNEPGGISIDDKYGFLYIADTNNHCIKVGHLNEKIVSELILKVPSADENGKKVTQSKKYAGENFDQEYRFDISKKVRNFSLLMRIKNVPKVEGGNWKLICPVFSPNPTSSGSVTKESNDDFIEVVCEEIPFVPWMREVYCIFSIIFCGKSACYKKSLKFLINFDCTKSQTGNGLENDNPQYEIEFTPTDRSLFGEP